MHPPSEILLSIRRMVKLYDRYMEDTRRRHRLTQLEITIVSFLHNNPGYDTAKDISEMRMLPKGNVSQGVEALIQKSLLRREPDARDRRRIHLALTEEAAPILAEIEETRGRFLQRIFGNFTPEELSFYAEMSDRILKNMQEDLEGAH